MALQFRRYAGAQVFAFDFGGSIRAAALAMGATGTILAARSPTISPSPLPCSRLPASTCRRARLAAEWVADAARPRGRDRHPGTQEHLWSALTSLASAPVSERTITGLSVLLQSNALKQALQPYTVGGPWDDCSMRRASVRRGRGSGFRNRGSDRRGRRARCPLLSLPPHRRPLRWAAHPAHRRRGWLALDDHGFAGQLREWLKTLRKKNASVIFATQSLADIDGSTIAPAIIESCPTRLFLPTSARSNRRSRPSIAASV